MRQIWYLVDKNNFVFNTFDTRSEAVREYKRYWKNGYDVTLNDINQQWEALAAQKAKQEKAFRKIKEAIAKEKTQ